MHNLYNKCMENLQLYLASRSPRRSTLIEQLGLSYQTLDVETDERPNESEAPADYVARLALEKARKGWELVNSGEVPVVGADTCIVLNGRIVGKVENRLDSLALLKQFSGSSHQVLTGVAMVGRNYESDAEIKQRVRVNSSVVTFRELSSEECEAYWDTGEPVDKAGGYAIQGIGAGFIKKIEGSYSGVMGLPLCELSELMYEFGIKWLSKHNNNPQLDER